MLVTSGKVGPQGATGPAGSSGGSAADTVNVATYGAPTGVDDYSAFVSAIAALPAAGGRIIVPAAAYILSVNPTWGSRSIYWDISPAATFSGAGTGLNKFPSMVTNGWQLAQGPFIQAWSIQPSPYSSPNIGGIGAFNTEIRQAQGYSGNSVALYAGAVATNTSPYGSTWSFNTVNTAEAWSTGWRIGAEIDLNCNSSTATAKGIIITGGGSVNPDTGLEVSRVDWYGLNGRNWNVGLHSTNSLLGLKIDGGDLARGITVNTTYTGSGGYGFILGAKQIMNWADMIVLQRNTETSPNGSYLRCTNTTGATDIFRVDMSGNVTSANNSPITDITSTIGSLTKRWLTAFIKTLYFGDGTTLVTNGVGSPEGVVTAAIGSLYTNTTGGAGTTLYAKESGTGNTGWVAK